MFSCALATILSDDFPFDRSVILPVGRVADLPLIRPPVGPSVFSDGFLENARIEVCGNSIPETAERAPYSDERQPWQDQNGRDKDRTRDMIDRVQLNPEESRVAKKVQCAILRRMLRLTQLPLSSIC